MKFTKENYAGKDTDGDEYYINRHNRRLYSTVKKSSNDFKLFQDSYYSKKEVKKALGNKGRIEVIYSSYSINKG